MTASKRGRLKTLERAAERLRPESRKFHGFEATYGVDAHNFRTLAANIHASYFWNLNDESKVGRESRKRWESRLLELPPETREIVRQFPHQPLQYWFNICFKNLLEKPHRIDFNLRDFGLEEWEPLVRELSHIDYPFLDSGSPPDHRPHDPDSSEASEATEALTNMASLMVAEFISIENRF